MQENTMKIRDGFVSNSSTTSFSIYGRYIDSDQIPFANLILFTKEHAPKVYKGFLKDAKDCSEEPKGEVDQSVADSLENETKIWGALLEALQSGDLKKIKRAVKDIVECDNTLLYELLYALDEAHVINIYTTEDGSIYIGRDWTTMRDDQTKGDFKKDTCELIALATGQKRKCEAISETISS
jgi:hypothetical protein